MSKILFCRICDEGLQTGCYESFIWSSVKEVLFSVDTDKTLTWKSTQIHSVATPEQSHAENVTEIRLKGKISD